MITNITCLLSVPNSEYKSCTWWLKQPFRYFSNQSKCLTCILNLFLSFIYKSNKLLIKFWDCIIWKRNFSFSPLEHIVSFPIYLGNYCLEVELEYIVSDMAWYDQQFFLSRMVENGVERGKYDKIYDVNCQKRSRCHFF